MENIEDTRFISQVLIASGLTSICSPLPHSVDKILSSSEFSHHESRIVSKAIREKMTPMLERLTKHRNWKTTSQLARISSIWRIVNQVQFDCFDPVAKILNYRTIRTALLKGADFVHTVYPPDMPRRMGDIDLLVRPPDIMQTREIVTANGFVEGSGVDTSRLQIEPLSKFDRKSDFDVSQQELPPFYKFERVFELDSFSDLIRQVQAGGRWKSTFAIIGDEVYLVLRIGIHHNIMPNVSLTDVWPSPREIQLSQGAEFFALSPTVMAWYLAAKFYHEFMIGGGACIRQFIDILAVIKKYHQLIDWEHVLEVASRRNMRPALYYVMSHVNEILGPCVPSGFIESISPKNYAHNRSHDWGDFAPRMSGKISTLNPLFD